MRWQQQVHRRTVASALERRWFSLLSRMGCLVSQSGMRDVIGNSLDPLRCIDVHSRPVRSAARSAFSRLAGLAVECRDPSGTFNAMPI